MSRSGLPENVYLFILNHVESLDALDVLLLLRRQTAGMHSDAVADQLRMPRPMVLRRLEQLQSGGLVRSDGQPRLWRLGELDKGKAKDLDDLAAHCVRDRITVVNLIASRNLERLKSLADAFRIRGKS